MQNKPSQLAFRVSLIYCLVAGVWILISDRAVVTLVSDPVVIGKISIFKGWAFVAVTALLLYFTLRNQMRRWEQQASARMQSEDKLRQLSQAVEQSPVSVIITDTKGNIEYVNRKFSESSGYSLEEIITQNRSILKSGESLPATYQELWNRITGGEMWSGELQNRKKNGELYWEWATISPVLDATGKIMHFLAVNEDITWRKRAEAALREREEQLRLFVEHSPAAIAMLDRDMKYLVVSHRWMEDYRLQDQSIIGRSHYEVFPEVPQRWIEIHRRCLAGAVEKCDEDTFPRSDGTTDWIRWEIQPWRQADGSIGGIIIFSEDITVRKRVDMALQESEQHYRSLFENMLNGFAFCRMEFDGDRPRDFTYLKVNPAFERLTGLKNVQGRKVSEVMPGIQEADPALFERYGRVARTGVPEQFEIYVEALKMWFAIAVYSPKKEHFVAVFDVITGRKQVEQALAYERDLLLTLLDNSPDNIYFKDLQCRFVRCSQTQVRHFGLSSQEELLGRTDFDFYAEAYARPRFEDEQEIIRTGRPMINKEEQEERKTGHVIWVSSTKMPWRDDAGKIIGTIGISRDITGHKQAELALQESEERYRQLFDLASDAVVLVDIETHRYVDVNQATQRLYGYSREEFLQMTPENVSAEPEKTRDHINSGDPFVPLRWHRKKNGERFAVEITANLINYRGRRTALVALRDVTARQLAEESHARLATAVEQAAESIVITDTQGTILYVNPAFEKISGYTRAEALGQNPRILKSGKHDAEFYRQMWAALARGETWHGHIINQRKNGALFEEDVTLSPVRDAAGKVVNYVAVKRDVTHELQLQAQYLQSQKMEAFGQLAGGVAHDFNNMLAVIMMQADLLKTDGNLTPTQSEIARDIGMAAERAANLTRQLLLFSRKQTVMLRDLDLNESVNNTAKMLRRTLGEDIQLQFKFVMQSLFIHADAGMMDQVLLNLAVNARDAMPKGGQLAIETSAVDFDESVAAHSAQARPGSFVCLSVSDTGSGIPAEILPNIFEPFFTTKEVGKGTGLGLATVFGIVQQHHGWINVYSEVGRGTTFRIYLPRLTGKSGLDSEEPDIKTLRRGNETILLVEDEAPLRLSIQNSLSQLGYRVLEAVNGAGALEIWKQHHDEIHLLLTDLVMPGGMNGKEVADWLLAENPKLKVIYTSGYSAAIQVEDLLLEEGVNFLTKPFAAHHLAQTVRNCLDKN